MRDHRPTFSAALRILGHHDGRALERLDRAFGAAILAAGVGLAALPATAPPVVVFALVWGWVDQKNQAMGLLRDLVSGLSRRVSRSRGRERRELVEAAHGVIVAAAFLEILEENLGPGVRSAIEARPDRLTVSAGVIFHGLYHSDIQPLDATRGFTENLGWVREWARGLFDGIGVPVGMTGREFARRVERRYESYFLRLASEVPEFYVWSQLGDHAGTRAVVVELMGELRGVLDSHGGALDRLERLLTEPGAADQDEALIALRRANRARLSHLVLPGEPQHQWVTFPTVDAAFVEPHYRTSHGAPDPRLADEDWWLTRPVRRNLYLALCAHVRSWRATRAPLLVLGHPGAGKSMLTRVIAARLPADSYTVVHVPLREVAADAPIVTQVRQALLHTTHQEIPWARLADRSTDTIRVVLLDGLDELLQATGEDRSDYLREVVEFQRVELEQERPVVVVVTSRTLVADRIEVPEQAVVVKLEDFDEAQVAEWLTRWVSANRAGIDAGRVRPLSRDEALLHHNLTRLPLLLLMLALHAADPAAPALDADLSRFALYERVFDDFTRREVGKRRPARAEDRRSAVAEQRERLAVAALAMFNRRAQYVREDDLRADLSVLIGQSGDPRDRVLGRFFFIHAAEAVLARTPHRAYEFLHATFGEYLVARYGVDTLRATDPEDDTRLYTLLSHQVWSTRQPVVDFAEEYFEQLPAAEQDHVRRTLTALIRTYRTRHRAPNDYRPTAPDLVRAPVVYLANLATLLVVFNGSDLTLMDMFGGTPAEALRAWRSTLSLWESLDPDSWRATLGHFTVTEELTIQGLFGAHWQMTDGYADLSLANLGMRPVHARVLCLGLAVTGELIIDREHWAESTLAWLAGLLVGTHTDPARLPAPPPTATETDIDRVRRAVGALPEHLRDRLAGW